MTLAEEFTLEDASVIGRLHVVKHTNNQDACTTLYNDDFFITVVSDGCSGSPHSEVGSYLTANKLAERLLNRLGMLYPPVPDLIDAYLEAARLDTTAFLRFTASGLGNTEMMLQDAMLATASGFVMTPEVTILFSIGDGVFFINGYEIDLDNDQAQYPDMLVYGAMDPNALKITHQGKFNHVVYPTTSVDTLLVATDGFRYVMEAEGKEVPGSKALVPSVTEILLSDASIKPLLRRMGREVRIAQYDKDLDISTQFVHKSLLLDDTTVVVIKRKDLPDDGQPCEGEGG